MGLTQTLTQVGGAARPHQRDGDDAENPYNSEELKG